MPESFTQPVDLSHPDLRGFNHKAAASSNTSFVRYPFLEATGDSTSVPSDDVQEDGANISCSRAQQDEVQNTMQPTSRRPRNKECSSKYYGVRFRPDLSKWVAEIRVAEGMSVDKKVWLGTYISEEGAAHAVDAARKILGCNKKKKPNFSCEQLEAYAGSLPPEFFLKNISDNTIFKAITEYVKGKAKQYANEFVSTPIPKEIRTSTPVNNNRQPGAGGDVSPSDAAAVCQLGSITTENKEVMGSCEEQVEADDSEEEVEVEANDSEEEVEANNSEDYNLIDNTEQEGPRSLFHSQRGRSSIPALAMDASCSQFLQDVYRKFHELGSLETAKNKKKHHEDQFTELKSSSESLKEPNLTKVDGPSTYLELGTKSLKNIENMISIQSSNSVLINQCQCHYLFDKLRESLNDAKACIDGLSPQNIQQSCCILESLAQTWKEGEMLVGDCCDAQWIQVAMILANAKEHFTSLIFKLRLYMQLFQSIFKEGATKEFLIKLQDRKWSDDVKDEEFPIIDEKALEDQQWLLSRLIEVGSIDSENLIKRLNHPGKIDAWKVAHKIIQRVPYGQIGKGGSTTVHKVVWLGKHFAEKCFFGPESKHFQEEASLLARLSHPNILPLFCFVTKAHSCSLVTELMDGDLHGLMLRRLDNHEIQGVPFKLLEAIDIMLQVAEGMHCLHQNKVVHRDLKSMNILVNCDGHDGHVYAKVADFGLSKTKESSCTYSNLTMDMGTTRWMAPELFGNFDQSVPIQVYQETKHPSLSNEQISKRYPFKVDIYSFGMVCYEILTGNIPFPDHTSMMELRKKIKDGLRPNLPEQCPQQLSKLIQACYHSDPATRPSFFEICVELRHIMCSLMIGCTL
ncbi:unnamed protein product [Sphagnum tenellum]